MKPQVWHLFVFLLLLVLIYSLTSVINKQNLDSYQNASQELLLPEFINLKDSSVNQVLHAECFSGKNIGFLWGEEILENEVVRIFDTVQCLFGAKGLVVFNKKREGDFKTPSGTFKLGPAFGYYPNSWTKMDYIQLDDKHYWVCESSSLNYNRLVFEKPPVGCAEKMKRSDDLYKLGLVIQYNMDPVLPGKGSAIFIHLQRESQTPTAGCIALAEKDLINLLGWIDPAFGPAIEIKYLD